MDEDVVDDVTAEDEDNEAEVEDDENVELVSCAAMKRRVIKRFSDFLLVYYSYEVKLKYLYLIEFFVCVQTEEKEEEEEALVGEVKASPNADTTILFVKGEGDCFISAV